MGILIKWDDVVNRYNKYADVVGADEDNFIPYAENYVHMGLASHFTIPFSNNNVTAKDLAIDVAMAKVLMFKDEEKANAMLGHVNSVMGMIRDGTFSMITSSGALISRTGEPSYSKTMDYAPIFGHGCIEDFHVSSSQLYDEESERDY